MLHSNEDQLNSARLLRSQEIEFMLLHLAITSFILLLMWCCKNWHATIIWFLSACYLLANLVRKCGGVLDTMITLERPNLHCYQLFLCIIETPRIEFQIEKNVSTQWTLNHLACFRLHSISFSTTWMCCQWNFLNNKPQTSGIEQLHTLHQSLSNPTAKCHMHPWVTKIPWQQLLRMTEPCKLYA